MCQKRNRVIYYLAFFILVSMSMFASLCCQRLNENLINKGQGDDENLTALVINIAGTNNGIELRGANRFRFPISMRISSAYDTSTEQSASSFVWKVKDDTRGGKQSLTTSTSLGPARWDLSLSATSSISTVGIDVSISYSESCEPKWEVVEWDLPVDARVWVLNRTLRWQAVSKRHLIDQWTPHLIAIKYPGFSAVLGSDAQSMLVTKRKNDGGVTIHFEADHKGNHPFRPYDGCWESYDEAHEKKRIDKSSYTRRASDLYSFRISITPGIDEYIVRHRFPTGFRSAISFTDHADQSDVARLGALMYGQWGTKEEPDSRPQNRGFVGHGLSMTKTVFVNESPRYHPQMASQEYRDLVKDLVRDGIEIGVHTVSGKSDDRNQTLQGLRAIDGILESRTWIDHQPSTNCEAISNRGYLSSDRSYYIVDLLKKHGYKYIWADIDLSYFGMSRLNMWDPMRPAKRRPILYQHTRVDSDPGDPIYLFSSLWFSLSLDNFVKEYSDSALDRFEYERGIHIAHTYLDAYSEKKKSRTLLEPYGAGFRLKDEVEAMFSRLAERQRRRGIWVTGISALGDHFLAMKNIDMNIAANGDIHLVNTSDEAVFGATFILLAQPERRISSESLWLNGTRVPSSHYYREDEQIVFWTDMVPDYVYMLSRRNEDGMSIPWGPVISYTLESRLN